MKSIFENVMNQALSPPPFYIQSSPWAAIGDTMKDDRTHASFFVNTAYKTSAPNYSCDPRTALVVPLVSDPVWGIPKENWASYQIKVDTTANGSVLGILRYGNIRDTFAMITTDTIYEDSDSLFEAIGFNQLLTWRRLNNTPSSPDYKKFIFTYEGGVSSVGTTLSDGIFKGFAVHNYEGDVAFPNNTSTPAVPVAANAYQLFIRNDWDANGFGIAQVRWHNSTPGVPALNIPFSVGPIETTINIPAFTHTAAIEVMVKTCPTTIPGTSSPK